MTNISLCEYMCAEAIFEYHPFKKCERGLFYLTNRVLWLVSVAFIQWAAAFAKRSS